jgi:hypothetical protein
MVAKEPLTGETAVAVAALLHLIRLMGAELVAGRHRDDVEVLVRAIETKLRSVQLPDDTPEGDVSGGMLLANKLLEPIFEDLRLRSQNAHLRDRLLAAPTTQIH